jgi:ADP-heptose:LPS heptosyltransferase
MIYMKHSIFIDGGIGRVITAIPALEEFVKKHSKDEIRIFVGGWDQVFWNHKVLQPLVFPIQQKGNWDYIKTSKRWFPEPYHHQGYIDGTSHLIDAFADLLEVKINNRIPTLNVWSKERLSIQKLLNNNGKKLIVFQPYGTGMQMVGNVPKDVGGRSLNVDDYLKIASNLSQQYNVVFIGEKQFEHPADNFTLKISSFNPDIRFLIALVSQADYFVGVDSVGQHIAHAFNIPGTIFMGSSLDKNVTYPEHFNIIRRPNIEPTYVPIRFPLMDTEFIERLNDGILDFSANELMNAIKNLNEHIKSCNEVVL